MLKIAYLCDLSPLESWTYSGGNSHICSALKKHVGDVHILSNQWHGFEFIRKSLHRSPDTLNIRARWRAHLMLSASVAQGVQRELSLNKYDVLFCAYSFHSLAGINKLPGILKVFTSDATPTIYKNSVIGKQFKKSVFAKMFDPFVFRAEKQVFRDNDLNLWPSSWLKQQADQHFGLTENQSVVVPWGANISDPALASQQPSISSNQQIHLLLVGRDWRAKGGPQVLEIVQSLLARGIDAKLSVVGCNPAGLDDLDFVVVYPSLDKKIPAQRKKFEDLFRTVHFLVMPSFESYGFVFCEASAYGLPSIGLRVGGVPIKENVNGHALPIGADTHAFSDKIISYIEDPGAYIKLRRSSRSYFEQTLNWDAWGKQVSNIIHSKL